MRKLLQLLGDGIGEVAGLVFWAILIPIMLVVTAVFKLYDFANREQY